MFYTFKKLENKTVPEKIPIFQAQESKVPVRGQTPKKITASNISLVARNFDLVHLYDTNSYCTTSF